MSGYGTKNSKSITGTGQVCVRDVRRLVEGLPADATFDKTVHEDHELSTWTITAEWSDASTDQAPPNRVTEINHDWRPPYGPSAGWVGPYGSGVPFGS